MLTLNFDDYRDKVLACWLGKNIGGTLGAPFEWKRQVNDVSFYTQDLGGEPLPNDDLDIQLLWLVALENHGVDIDAHTLAEYWCGFVTPHWSEYGTGKINMRSGLVPPLCGSWGNAFKHSCGAFIRSEIWACIAPARPDLATHYAREDAILDHGDGEGTYAEVFCAAMESAAFVVDNLRTVIDIGLSYIPENCGVAHAVRTAIACHEQEMDWQDARDEILRQHRGGSFMRGLDRTSPADREKGFAEGQHGYDVPSNIAILVYGLLYGGDDFDRMICTTVNMGEDTDCTGATAGSVYGILHGTAGIPQKWIDPIGRGIKTIAINTGDMQGRVPHTVDELTDRTARVAQQVLLRGQHSPVILSHTTPTDLQELKVEQLYSRDHGAALQASLTGPLFRFDWFEVFLDYGSDPIIRTGEPRTLRIDVRTRMHIQGNLNYRWHLPETWTVTPGPVGMVHVLPSRLGGGDSAVDFTFTAERIGTPTTRCILELTQDGRPDAMIVPVVFVAAAGNATA